MSKRVWSLGGAIMLTLALQSGGGVQVQGQTLQLQTDISGQLQTDISGQLQTDISGQLQTDISKMKVKMRVPEIDIGAGGSVLALLAGTLLLMQESVRRSVKRLS